MQIKDFAVEQWMNEWETKCTHNVAETCVYSLTLDQLFELTNTDKKAWLDSLCSRRFTYGDIEGQPGFLEGVARLYKTVEPGPIVPTHGATGANSLVISTLLQLDRKNGYHVDVDALDALVTDDTKLICINNPDNPTGALLDTDTLKAIVEVARKHDAWVLCDEVYRLLTQTDEYSESVIDLYDKAIVTASMSKVWSFAGLRLGWAVTKSPELRRALLSHRDYNLISAGIFSESVAELILGNASVILERSRRIVRQNLAVLEKWVESEPHLSFVKPEAGTTALVYYDYDIDSRTFCIDMIKKSGALVTPGDCFEEPKSMRIGYAYSDNTDDLQKGLDAISAYMRTLE